VVNPLLTIVIPTADRHHYLPETLHNLTNEIIGSNYKIKIIIADNCSTPPIRKEILGSLSDSPLISTKRFDVRVGVGESIVRSSKLAHTKYVWVFGDDDLIVEGGLKVIVESLGRYMPDYLYMNRFIAPNDMSVLERVEHEVTLPLIEGKLTGSAAVTRFTHHPGFISSLIVKKGMFEHEDIDFERLYPGYGFLGCLYYKSLKGVVTYISFPYLIQRRSITLWKKQWPLYWLVSVPDLFKWLEKEGAEGAYKRVLSEVNPTVIRTLVSAKASGVSVRDKLWYLAVKDQSYMKKWAGFLLRYLLPVSFAQFVVRLYIKVKG